MKTLRIQFLVVAIISLMALPALAAELNLSFTNLPPLDESTQGIYEGWAIINGAPVSTGVFNVDEMGQAIMPGSGAPVSFMVDDNIGMASAIKISIEPVDDMDPAPSGLIVLTGMVEGESTALVTAIPGLDMLMTSAGSYILATPSDNGMDTTNDDQGIWFLSMPGPMVGLTGLPDLGPNWVYEGWVVDVSGSSPMPYTTGTFSMADGFDSDEAGCNAGGPPFPGQDYVAFQCGPELDLDNGDYAAVLTIEPVPDNSVNPFFLKPLAGLIPMDALMGGNMMANQVEDTFPAGTATITGTVAVSPSNWGSLKAVYR